MVVGKQREHSQWTPDTPCHPFATATEFLLYNQTPQMEWLYYCCGIPLTFENQTLFSPFHAQIAAVLVAAAGC